MNRSRTLTRRQFLQISATAGGGLLVSLSLPSCTVESLHGKALNVQKMNPFLKIAEDNSVHIVLSKVEMGQGIWTTLPMLVAEELDCDWTKIHVEHSPPGTAEDFSAPLVDRFTGGSETTKTEFERYRYAGATVRAMLIKAGAKRFGVKEENCRTENGFIITNNGQQVSYGEVATDASHLPIPAVTLRNQKDWRYLGKSQKRLDGAEKINGELKYGIDIHFEGLLTAVVAHAPVFEGKIKTYDASKTLAIEGVRQVVPIPTGLAVIADNFWLATVGRAALIVEWDHGTNENINTESLAKAYTELAATSGKTYHKKGDVASSLKLADKIIDAEYYFPYLAHTPMEPLNCIVTIDERRCQIWAATQSPLLHQFEVANFLNLKPEQVEFHTPHMGGSFGRRGSFSDDWIMEAVHIAKTSGKSVKLIWSREDDIKGGYYRPVYAHRVSIAVDKKGLPMAWQHRIVGQSLFVDTPLESLIIDDGIDYSSVTLAAPYSEQIPNLEFQLHTTKIGVPVLPWRSVGHTHTAFVVETLIDELAAIASVDPIIYRRSFLTNSPRHLSVLDMVAEKAGWFKPQSKNKFRGVAVCEAMGSYIAQVAELSIEDDQEIKVHRVVCAIDCGIAVNPDGVRAQIEGGIIFGLTAALYGEVTIKNGQVQQSNFHDYKMLRMEETPSIEVHIVPSTEKMGGAGEPGVVPIAAAIANALFVATGKRFRKLPLRL